MVLNETILTQAHNKLKDNYLKLKDITICIQLGPLTQ